MARVLIVDDEPDVRFLLRRLLERDGHEVDEAPNGASALALLQERTVDVVIVDTMMPVMDGATFVGELAAREVSPPAIIVWTESPDPGIDADAVFAKPYGGAQIPATVTELARRSRSWNA